MHTALKHIRAGSVGDLRCDCGKLLARVLHAVIEFKCPRCKRVVLIASGQRFEPAGTAPCTCADLFPPRRLLDDQEP
jgi:phage FluMu protein Com